MDKQRLHLTVWKQAMAGAVRLMQVNEPCQGKGMLPSSEARKGRSKSDMEKESSWSVPKAAKE
jgi:hypothetical protein